MNFNRLRLVLAVLVLPVLFGFVLERMGGARLPVTPASPSAKFVWDGSVPHITERDKYRLCHESLEQRTRLFCPP